MCQVMLYSTGTAISQSCVYRKLVIRHQLLYNCEFLAVLIHPRLITEGTSTGNPSPPPSPFIIPQEHCRQQHTTNGCHLKLFSHSPPTDEGVSMIKHNSLNYSNHINKNKNIPASDGIVGDDATLLCP